MKLRHRTPALALTLLVFLVAAAARADDKPSGITVSGEGVAIVQPDMAEITAHVSGEAELGADALVKFRDTLRRATAALEKLNIPGLKTERQGVGLANAASEQAMQQAWNNGQGNTNIKLPTIVQEDLVIRLAGIDKMEPEKAAEALARIFDALRDVGLSFGKIPTNPYEMQMMRGQNNGAVVFKVADDTAAREKAVALAMEDARARAGKIAALAQVKLGKVAGVTEPPSSSAATDNPMAVFTRMVGVRPPKSDDSAASGTLAPIAVRVALTVNFEIEK